MQKLHSILLRVPAPVKLTLIALLPVFLYCVPIEQLNQQHSICLFKNIFGRECWGCGITRAIISAFQFNFAAAFQYNKLVVIVLPLLFFEWLKIIRKLLMEIKIKELWIRIKQIFGLA